MTQQMGQSHRQVDESARPLQLRDYVEVLRRRRWLIILMMVLGFWTASLYTLIALQTSRGDWRRFWMGQRVDDA